MVVGQSTNLPQEEADAAAQPLPAQAKADVFKDAATQSVETEEGEEERLRAKKMSLSKNNLDDEVRKAGGALSTDRALLLARVLK